MICDDAVTEPDEMDREWVVKLKQEVRILSYQLSVARRGLEYLSKYACHSLAREYAESILLEIKRGN